jgi:hypothetical protein
MLFCENLANTMKLDEIAQDAGLDVNGEALLARAKQLVKLEVSRVYIETNVCTNNSVFNTE